MRANERHRCHATVAEAAEVRVHASRRNSASTSALCMLDHNRDGRPGDGTGPHERGQFTSNVRWKVRGSAGRSGSMSGNRRTLATVVLVTVSNWSCGSTAPNAVPDVAAIVAVSYTHLR